MMSGCLEGSCETVESAMYRTKLVTNVGPRKCWSILYIYIYIIIYKKGQQTQ